MTTPGRAAITIVGDASKLGAQLERDAQAAIDGVDLNTETISDQIGGAFREGAREGEAALSEVERASSSTSRRITKAFDEAGREIERTFTSIARDGKVTTTVVEKGFDAAGERIERSFRFAAASVAVSAELIAVVNRKAADSAADSWERAGERIERAFAEARREVIVDQAEMAAAAALTSAAVSDEGNAIRKVFSKIGTSIAGAVASLGTLAAEEINPVGLATTLLSLAVTVGAIVLLAGPILVLAAAIADLAGALTLLPAAGAVAAASIATLVIAFHGFGDAISAIIDGDPEKIAEALKKLAPEARGVALEFQKLLPAFRSIGQLVQQRFFIQLEGELTRIANNVLPTVRRGMVGLATDLGDLISRIGDVFTTPAAAKQLNTIFEATRQTVKAAADDFDRFVAGLLAAAAALAPSFAEISGWITDIVGDFGDWLSQAAEDGSLQRFLDKAIATGKSLFSLLGSIGSLVGTLLGGNAADEGRNFIDTLTDGINDLNDALKSPEGQQTLAEIIESAKLLGIAFGAAIHVIGFLIDVVSDLHDATVATVDFFNRAGNDIARFWDGLTQGATDAWHAVTSFFSSAGSDIGDFWNDLTTTVGDAAESVLTWFEELPGKVGDFLSSLPGVVLDAFDAVQNAMIDSIGFAIAAVIVFFTDLPGQLMGAAVALITWVTNLGTQVGEAATSIWDDIVAFFESIPGRLSEVWASLVAQATAALLAIGEFAVDIWNNIVSFFSQLPGKIGSFFAGVYTAAVDKLTSLVNWVKGLPGRVLSALGDFGHLLYDSGARVIQGLIDGITSKFNRLKEKISEGVGIIRDHLPFSPAKTGPLSGNGSPQIAGAKIGEMIAAGLDAQLPLITSAAARAAGAASPLGAIGQAGVTPLTGTAPGAAGQSVLSPLGTTAQNQTVVYVTIDGRELDAVVDERVEQRVDVEVRRLMAGTRGS